MPRTLYRLIARHRLMAIISALILIHVFVFEMGLGGDGWGHFALLESVLEDRDLDLANNMYGVRNGLFPMNKGDRWVTQYPPGLALFDAPFYAASMLIDDAVQIKGGFGERSKTPPYSNVTPKKLTNILSVIFAHNAYAFFTVILFYASLLKLGFRREWSALSAFVTFFAGPLHFYAQSGLSHAVSVFTAALFLYLFCCQVVRAQRGEGSGGLTYWIGAVLGLSMLVRYPNFVFVFVFGMYFLIKGDRFPAVWEPSWKAVRCRLYPLLRLAAGFVAVIWIIPIFWRLHFLSWWPREYEGGFFDPRSIPMLNVWFYPRHGFFLWHPIFLLAIAGFVLLWVRMRREGWAVRQAVLISATSFVAISILYGLFNFWFGGFAYSQRYLTVALPFLAIGLCYVLERTGWRWPKIVLLALGTAYSYCIFILNYTRLVYTHRPHGFARYIWDHLYIFKKGVPASEIWAKITGSSFTMRALPSFLSWVIAALVAALLVWLVIELVRGGTAGGAVEATSEE